MVHARCIKTNKVSQRFGESIACVYPDNRVVGKVAGVCPLGSVDLYKSVGLLAHNGTDRAAWFKETVYHTVGFDGWVKTEVDSAGGIGIDIVSNEPLLKCTEPNCFETHYIKYRAWHHWEIPDGVYDGKQVKMGAFIAIADSTGLSGGHHVHDSLKWCDKNGVGLHKDNGYYGAFDYTKHPGVEAVDEFVIDYLKKQAEIQNVEAQVIEAQLTLIQVLNKYIFLLQENITKLITKVGGIFKN